MTLPDSSIFFTSRQLSSQLAPSPKGFLPTNESAAHCASALTETDDPNRQIFKRRQLCNLTLLRAPRLVNTLHIFPLETSPILLGKSPGSAISLTSIAYFVALLDTEGQIPRGA